MNDTTELQKVLMLNFWSEVSAVQETATIISFLFTSPPLYCNPSLQRDSQKMEKSPNTLSTL